MEKKSIAERSIEASLIRDRLAKADVGDIITYATMSELIGRNIQDRRWFLTTALNSLLNELPPHRKVFSAIENIGVKRLSDEEIVASSSTRYTKKLRRASRKEAKRIAAVEVDNLSRENQTALFTAQSLIGAISTVTKSSMVERIATKIENSALPPAKTLDIFRNGKDKS